MNIQIPQLLVSELIKRGLFKQEDVPEMEQDALKNDKDFGEILVDKGLISDDDLLKIKNSIYKLSLVNVAEIKIDQSVLDGIPEHIVNFYQILPFYKDDDVLRVALVNPENIDALEALKFLATEKNLKLEKYLISYTDFKNLSKGFKSLTSEIDKALESLPGEKDGKKKGKPGDNMEAMASKSQLENITAEAPVTRVVASIVKHAVDTKASDIHIEPFPENIKLRLRIDGILQTVLTLPTALLSALVTRIKILSNLKIDESRLAQDGRFSTSLAGRTIDFRVSTFPTRNGEKVVLRILDPFVGNVGLEDLGLAGRSLRLIKENIAKPFGAVLITGPTGSGKSTTLAAILRQINSDEINVVTLEDPIEYYVTGVNQSQIHEEIGYTFADGLRHILRQDPDVIMVGEIRDGETAKLATQAALTGHVVLSTLHTNDTIGVIPRLIDMGVEKYLLAPTLNLALAQRLLRKLCQHCKVAEEPNSSEKKILEDSMKEIPLEEKKEFEGKNPKIYKAGPGCKECNNKGYKGRLGIFETLEIDDAIERIILSDISEEKLKEEAKKQGMVSMFQDGVLKVLRGLTSIEELLQVAQQGEAEPEQSTK